MKEQVIRGSDKSVSGSYKNIRNRYKGEFDPNMNFDTGKKEGKEFKPLYSSTEEGHLLKCRKLWTEFNCKYQGDKSKMLTITSMLRYYSNPIYRTLPEGLIKNRIEVELETL